MSYCCRFIKQRWQPLCVSSSDDQNLSKNWNQNTKRLSKPPRTFSVAMSLWLITTWRNQQSITGAIPFGVGAILFQVNEDGSTSIVAYASKALSPAESNHSQVEKEALRSQSRLLDRQQSVGSHLQQSFKGLVNQNVEVYSSRARLRDECTALSRWVQCSGLFLTPPKLETAVKRFINHQKRDSASFLCHRIPFSKSCAANRNCGRKSSRFQLTNHHQRSTHWKRLQHSSSLPHETAANSNLKIIINALLAFYSFSSPVVISSNLLWTLIFRR